MRGSSEHEPILTDDQGRILDPSVPGYPGKLQEELKRNTHFNWGSRISDRRGLPVAPKEKSRGTRN